MSRIWSLSLTLCALALGMREQTPLCAQPQSHRIDRPEDLFEESADQDVLVMGSWQPTSAGESPSLHLPDPDEEFAAGAASTGRIPTNTAMGGGPPGEERAPFRFRLFGMPARDVQGQSGRFALSGEEFDLGYPLRIEDDGIWLAMAGVRRLDIHTSAVLPDSGLPVPSQLWDLEAGVMRVRDLGDGRKAGGMFRVGSPSDQPFGAFRDMTVTFLGFLTIPARERDAWSFSLFYSPTGQIIFPIPGVAYVWRPNDQLEAQLGIPFSLDYRPTETLRFTASYMPLNNVQVLLRQSLGPSWSVYGGYRTMSETFLLAERDNSRERTYLFDQRLTVGLQRELGRGWNVDLSTAYVFDRRFFQAEKFSGPRRDVLAIDPGVAGMLQFTWTR